MTPTPAARDEREEFRKFEDWCQSQFGFSSTNLMMLDGRDMRAAWVARAALAESEMAEVREQKDLAAHELEMLRDQHEACIKDAYQMLGIDGSDGEFRYKWVALEISCVVRERDELRAELERVKADNRAKNGSMKAFGEQIARLQLAVKNRDRMLAKTAIDASLDAEGGGV